MQENNRLFLCSSFISTTWPMFSRCFFSYLPTRFAMWFPVFLLVTSLLSCGSVQVYKEPDKPFFYSNELNHSFIGQGDSVNVLTFNIKMAEKIQLAIEELQAFQQTNNVDIYLLQEMDEQGVESIAKELKLNYLYIPIVYNKMAQKNIGNAILTKGTITHPAKLILPHSKWLNKRRRHVTIGEVNIHQKKILVYSVHTETVMMSSAKRMDQVDAIIEHATLQFPNYQYFLIGGDFNTLCSRDAELAVKKFKDIGFDWATASVGSTARAFFGLIKPRHDYLFSRGLKLKSASKIELSRASDHSPVFATLGY